MRRPTGPAPTITTPSNLAPLNFCIRPPRFANSLRVNPRRGGCPARRADRVAILGRDHQSGRTGVELASTDVLAGAPATRRYQWLLVGLLTAEFRHRLFRPGWRSIYRMPSVQPELGLVEYGGRDALRQSALSVELGTRRPAGWATVGCARAAASRFSIFAALIFSSASFLSGGCDDVRRCCSRPRLLMGAAEGGVMPISQALVAAEVRARTAWPCDGCHAEFRGQSARQLPRP